uniref:Uncharacterized protein n=1 Tax=Aegilops tauschii subsp. strangulata TaxID=200361 RepID=A0A453BCT7_AEGTS
HNHSSRRPHLGGYRQAGSSHGCASPKRNEFVCHADSMAPGNDHFTYIYSDAKTTKLSVAAETSTGSPDKENQEPYAHHARDHAVVVRGQVTAMGELPEKGGITCSSSSDGHRKNHRRFREDASLPSSSTSCRLRERAD